MRWALLTILVLTLAISTGCVTIDTHVTVHRDGSGIMSLHITATDPAANDQVELVVDHFHREYPDADISYDESEGNTTATITVRTADVNDVGFGLTYTRDRNTHRVDIVESAMSVPVPMTLSITMPGIITSSNGDQLDPRTVRWTNFRQPCWVKSSDRPSLSPLIIIIVLLSLMIATAILWRRISTRSGLIRPRFCIACGGKLETGARFCSACGASTDHDPVM